MVILLGKERKKVTKNVHGSIMKVFCPQGEVNWLWTTPNEVKVTNSNPHFPFSCMDMLKKKK